MALLAHALRWDLSLQSRSFIYPATAASTAMICAFIWILPVEGLSPAVAAFFIFLDPATVGLSFVGAIVLMEKSQGTLSALGVTPMQPWVYVASKATSLTLVTFASGIAVAWVATDGVFDALRLVLALTLASTVAVLVGFTCVARAPSMNKLMITLLWVTTVAYLPLLLFFDVLPEPWGLVLAPLPSYAMLTSFSWAADPNLGFEAGLPALGYLLAWCVVGGWWAVREYTRSIVTGGR